MNRIGIKIRRLRKVRLPDEGYLSSDYFKILYESGRDANDKRDVMKQYNF